MKLLKTIGSFLLLSCLLFNCDTRNNVEPYYENQFFRLYGINGDQWARQLVMVSDGFVIVGETTTETQGRDIFLVKTDFTGKELWHSSFGTIFNDWVGGLTRTPGDGMLVAVNSSVDDDDLVSQILLYNVTSTGVADTVFSHGDSINNYSAKDINIVSPGAGGGYIVTGSVFYESENKSSLLNLRLNDSFMNYDVVDWNPVYDWGHAGSRTEGIKLVEYNNEFYCLFNSNSTFAGQVRDFNPFIVQLKDGGLVENPYSLGEENVDEIALSFYLTGNELISLYSSDTELIVKKSTLNGSVGSPKVIPTSRIVESVDIIEDVFGNYLITGNEIIGTNDTDIYMASLSSIGGFNSLKWERTYGGELNFDRAAKGAVVLNDGSIVFLGTVELGHQSKLALFKTNATGDLNP